MSVARELGLESVDPVVIVAKRWAQWSALQPDLGAVKVPTDLQRWLGRGRGQASDQTHQEINRVLRALAVLGSRDGDDDPDAAVVLCWVMLPAACAVASRNEWRSPRLIDQIVAAQLWIIVRDYPWQTRHGSVAANIARDLNRAVIDDLHSQDRDRAGHVVPVDPNDFTLLPLGHPDDPDDPRPADELIELLDEAIESQVIDWGERALLLTIAEASAAAPAGRQSGSGVAGLLTADVEAVVAQRYQSSPRSIRRRAGACVDALARFKGGRR